MNRTPEVWAPDRPPWLAFDADEPDSASGLVAALAVSDGPLLAFVATPRVESEDWAAHAVVTLATRVAGRGRKVLLADLSLDRPRLHEILSMDNAEGVTDACLYGASLRRIATEAPGHGFLFAPVGSYTPDPESVARHARWDSLARSLTDAGVVAFLYVPLEVPGFHAIVGRAARVVLLMQQEEAIAPEVLAGLGDKLTAALGPTAAPEIAAAAKTMVPPPTGEIKPAVVSRAPIPERQLLATGRKGHKWNIILAEDNVDYATLVQLALDRVSPRPVQLEWASDGDAALAAVEKQPPHLLILDLHMPRRSGHEVLERLKKSDELRRIPVAVLSATTEDEDIARAYGLGSNHFIQKPRTVGELERRLKSLLDELPELGGIHRGAGEIEATGMAVRATRSGHFAKIAAAFLLVLAAAGALYFYLAR
ncbi:MAG: response regulator [Gemmatimonadetes bacterium]|nr:response regulator [Gemmatimonadota bacterium]